MSSVVVSGSVDTIIPRASCQRQSIVTIVTITVTRMWAKSSRVRDRAELRRAPGGHLVGHWTV